MEENDVYNLMADYWGPRPDELTRGINAYFYCNLGIKEYVNNCFRESEQYVRISSQISDLVDESTDDWKTDIIEEKLYLDLDDKSKFEIFTIYRPKIQYLKEPEKTEEIMYRLNSQIDQVFNYLIEYEYPNTMRFIENNGGNNEQAREIFQEAITLILERIYCKKLEIKSSFSAYLYSVARNLWIKQMKERKLHAKVVDEIAYSETEISVIEHRSAPVDNYEIICSAIEQLGDPCRKLLEYFYFRNLDWQTIASEMGYSSPESARNQKYKCLERIREQLKEK